MYELIIQLLDHRCKLIHIKSKYPVKAGDKSRPGETVAVVVVVGTVRATWWLSNANIFQTSKIAKSMPTKQLHNGESGI